jgi:hypothetical protein
MYAIGKLDHSTMATDVAQRVAVLICCSDNRMDILERVLPSVYKFWPDCPYPIYVGLNKQHDIGPRITPLVAQPSEWRRECLDQVAQIPQTHLIVLLDDFLFLRPVDQGGLASLLTLVRESNLQYLRLAPIRKSLLAEFFSLGKTGPDLGVRPIREGRPFYSGLQPSIWNKAHFMSLLELEGSIWDFEHHRISGAIHHVITGRSPISYSHLVDKGRWLPYARALLSRAGLSADLGTRPVWPAWIQLRLALDKARLHVFGTPIN